MGPEEHFIMVKWIHVGLRALFWVYAALLMTWCHFSLVGDIGKGLFHISFWLAIEIFYLAVGFSSTGFGIMAFGGQARVEAESAVQWGILCQILSVGVAAKNVVHIVFISIELNGSPDNYWFLVMLLILIIVLLLMDIAALWLYSHYKRILSRYAEYGREVKKFP